MDPASTPPRTLDSEWRYPVETVTDEPEDVLVASKSSMLSVERYAEVLAHVIYFRLGAEAQVLSQLGIDRAAWVAADARWTAALVGEALEKDRPMPVLR